MDETLKTFDSIRVVPYVNVSKSVANKTLFSRFLLFVDQLICPSATSSAYYFMTDAHHSLIHFFDDTVAQIEHRQAIVMTCNAFRFCWHVHVLTKMWPRFDGGHQHGDDSDKQNH